jgi:hypothetical protein
LSRESSLLSSSTIRIFATRSAHSNPVLVAAKHPVQAHGAPLFKADSLTPLGQALRRLSDGAA